MGLEKTVKKNQCAGNKYEKFNIQHSALLICDLGRLLELLQ